MSALHPRTVIRKGVAALLRGRTSAGQRVFASRVAPFMARELPAIGVYTTEEDIDDGETSPRRYTRTPLVVVQLVVESDQDAEDVLDALALEVEALLLGDPTWGDLADDSLLTKAETFLVEGGRSDYACHAMTWRAEYQSRPGLLSESTLDDFATANVRYDLAPADGVADAVDAITLPTT